VINPICLKHAQRHGGNARATTLVEKALRKEVVPQGRACGARDHFLERVRVLYKDRFPINTGGLTISITR